MHAGKSSYVVALQLYAEARDFIQYQLKHEKYNGSHCTVIADVTIVVVALQILGMVMMARLSKAKNK